MKKSILKNLIFMLVFAICLISFAGVAIPGEKAVQTVKGEIMSMDTIAGQVIIKDESGKMLNMQANPEMDLKGLKEGDKVTVETHGGKLKSIVKNK